MKLFILFLASCFLTFLLAHPFLTEFFELTLWLLQLTQKMENDYAGYILGIFVSSLDILWSLLNLFLLIRVLNLSNSKEYPKVLLMGYFIVTNIKSFENAFMFLTMGV